ncbi:EAL domain-containing protein [Xanthobacter sp. AM11]|uniref:EAL domain-containing protein n=1 Tax=Xanthobacter sp. AM11 TaxID=3380643 RepID=UPI0039BFD2DE
MAAIAFVSAVYLVLDFHRMRSSLADRYRGQTLSLAHWTDRTLDHLAGMVRDAARGPNGLCSPEGMGGLVRQFGTIPVVRMEVRDETATSCAWQQGNALERLCAGVPGGDLVRIPLDLGGGRRVLLDLFGNCLFGAIVPMDAENGISHRLLSNPPDESVDGDDDGIWSVVVSPMRLQAGSGKWPVSVVISAPGSTLVQQWAASLPLQLCLISGLGLALWFGPMSVVRRRLSVEGQVRTALRRGDFFLAYLPTVDLASKSWVGAEALLRWRHKHHGVLMPNAFIPWIETSPLIHDTTRWVMIQAAQDLNHMSQRVPDFSIAVNVPPNQFIDPRLVAAADEAFGSRPLALCQVVFELTERQMLDYDAPGLRYVMEELRRRGAQIAVDDFGVGFSNLTLLGMIDVDYVKIDRSFLREEAWADPHMLEAMVPLLRDLGVVIIAEGIESERQLDRVRRCGIRFAQGFLFSRPIELEMLLAALSPAVADPEPA